MRWTNMKSFPEKAKLYCGKSVPQTQYVLRHLPTIHVMEGVKKPRQALHLSGLLKDYLL